MVNFWSSYICARFKMIRWRTRPWNVQRAMRKSANCDRPVKLLKPFWSHTAFGRQAGTHYVEVGQVCSAESLLGVLSSLQVRGLRGRACRQHLQHTAAHGAQAQAQAQSNKLTHVNAACAGVEASTATNRHAIPGNEQRPTVIASSCRCAALSEDESHTGERTSRGCGDAGG